MVKERRRPDFLVLGYQAGIVLSFLAILASAAYLLLW
jgi:hypothetical protein